MDRSYYDIRPIGVGELIDRAIWLYRDHFKTLILISAAVLAPVGVIQILVELLAERTDSVGTFLLISLLAGVIAVLAQLAAFAGVTAATSQAVLAGKTGFFDAYDAAFGSVFRLFRLIILVSLAVGGLMLTLIGIPAAIFVAISWVVAGQVLVIEQTGARAALGRSWGLLKNNRLRALGIVILVGGITTIVSLLFQAPAFAVNFAALGGDEQGLSYRVAWLVSQLFAVCGEVMISPIQYVAWTLLYYDLRARVEGLDLEMDVTTIGYAPEPAPGLD